jgi:hypothetical protein
MQWKKVQALVVGGRFFHSCEEAYPETLKEVPSFLRKQRVQISEKMQRYPDYLNTIMAAAANP